MKAARHVRTLFHQKSKALPVHAPRPRLRLPSTRQVESALRVALIIVLFGTAIWYLVWHAAQSGAPPTQVPAAGLELLFSGALTGPLSLSEAKLRDVRCDTSGFRVMSSQTVVFPLELTFTGVTAETAGKRSGEAQLPPATTFSARGVS